MKALKEIVLAAFALGVAWFPCYADTVTKTTSTTITSSMRTDAPLYIGPVQEVELLELTLADFDYLAGGDPTTGLKQYNAYQSELKHPKSNSDLALYKMKITDHDLTLANFQGPDVSPELAQTRYQEYLRINPIPVDGRNVRYAYVFHAPITQPANKNG